MASRGGMGRGAPRGGQGGGGPPPGGRGGGEPPGIGRGGTGPPGVGRGGTGPPGVGRGGTGPPGVGRGGGGPPGVGRGGAGPPGIGRGGGGPPGVGQGGGGPPRGGRGGGPPRGGGRGGGSSGDATAQLSQQFCQLQVAPVRQGPATLFPFKPPRNPNSRRVGRPVALISNLFAMSFTLKKPIYFHGVTIEIEVPPTEDEPAKSVPKKLGDVIRTQVIDKAIRIWIAENKPNLPKDIQFSYVYDKIGASIYCLFNLLPDSEKMSESRVELDLDIITKEGKLGTEKKFFRVKIHSSNRLDLNEVYNYCTTKSSAPINTISEMLRAINVILRGQVSTIPKYVLTPAGVYQFDKSMQKSISPGVILNRGYHASARVAECGPVLNVANSSVGFYEEIDLVGFLQSRYSVRDLSKPLRKEIIAELKKELYNKQVEARHINYGKPNKPHYRRYRVTDIKDSAEYKFTMVDNTTKKTDQVTIQKYFKDTYKVNIKYPKLPCVVDKERRIPLEVCHLIEKQKVTRKFTPDETAETIKLMAVKPDVHFNHIRQSIEDITKTSRSMQDFGIQLNPRPIEVEGYELDPIGLVGGANSVLNPRDGQYDARRARFYKPATLSRWGLAFIQDDEVERDLRGRGVLQDVFCKRFTEGGQKKGVRVDQFVGAIFLSAHNYEMAQLKHELRGCFKTANSKKIDQIIMVLPSRTPDWVYRYLQYLEATTNDGRGPQESRTRVSCLKYQNYMRKVVMDNFGGEMFISNLWLKYNTKLGGINHVLLQDPQSTFLQDGYIFISVDVCHPAPGDKLIQSVAASVGMWDITNANISYRTSLQVQKKMRENHSTIEEVGAIDVMFGEILDAYYAKKKKWPTKIVVLRDGVSEGQFKMVLEKELRKVQACLQNKYTKSKAPRPQLTCLVVQKRHKVRFMRKEPVQTPKGPNFNIQPGTVVDKTVTHPTDFCFYLAPHKAIQGTSRPSHIYVIYDEINFSQDMAQRMIHVLSYLSPRCTKSTSIPTPVNLADLAAERGKNLVISWNDDNTSKLSEDERLKKLNQLLSNLGDANYLNTLFYV